MGKKLCFKKKMNKEPGRELKELEYTAGMHKLYVWSLTHIYSYAIFPPTPVLSDNVSGGPQLFRT